MITAQDLLARKSGGMITVPQKTTVADTLEVMDNHNVGAILVTHDERIVGIWTERDLMRDTLMAGFDPHKTLVGEVMTRQLHHAAPRDTAYELMDMFLGLRIRHLLVREDGEYVGILSSGDVMKAALQDKSNELRSLNEMVSWDYYEEWRFASEAHRAAS